MRRSAKTTPSRSSNQSWSPNSGQVTGDGSRNPALVLASEQQQSSASILTLPQQQNQQAGTQTQLSSSLHQPQIGSVQYQPSGNNPEPPTTDALGQYQPTGNNETPLAGDDLNSNVIVNAQLTHLISRDDAAQGHDAPDVPDVLMPDAPAVHDIATPRRTVGGRCRKWCISAQPASGKRKCAACNLCGIRFTHGEARKQHWGNRETNHHYVHAHCVNGGLGHDHEFFPKQATDQDADDAVTRQRTPSPEQQRIEKYCSLSLRIPIKPQQLRHLTVSEISLDEKRLFAWMKRSWISSGLNTSHGTASKTYVARRTSNLPRGSGLRCSKPNMPFFEPSITTAQLPRPQSQPGKLWC